jgi:hypothetical protein
VKNMTEPYSNPTHALAPAAECRPAGQASHAVAGSSSKSARPSHGRFCHFDATHYISLATDHTKYTTMRLDLSVPLSLE